MVLFSKFRRNPGLIKKRMIKAHAVILTIGSGASLSYIIAPHLAQLGLDYEVVEAGDGLPELEFESKVPVIVINRYLPRSWVKQLREFKRSGAKIIYFMDDDLFDAGAITDLPSAYARKIKRMALDVRKAIEALCEEFWFSTPFLCAKYTRLSPALLTPRVGSTLYQNSALVKVCYHGTASHHAEILWLAPVVSRLQAHGATQFEIFGNHDVNRLYRDMAAVSILHPMSWENYLAYTANVRQDIALAPLLENPFNAARGPTKFFDFARMGAVGIYSDVAPYDDFIRDGIDGILLPNDPGLWVETVMSLAGDRKKRERMQSAVRERLAASA
jgi:hypothetical protein